MITTTVSDLLALQEAQLTYYCEQLSAPAAAELKRRIAARTTHYPRPDMEIETAYAEIPRGADIEAERDRILDAIAAIDPLALMDMTEAAVAMALAEPPKSKPKKDYAAAHQKMKPFMSNQQWAHVAELMKGEEGEFFQDKMIELAGIIETMPRTGKVAPQPIVHLHYFRGSADWHITELDKGAPDDTPEQFMTQCFGRANLFGDPSTGEWGYISIPEVVQCGAELDFHWTPHFFRV